MKRSVWAFGANRINQVKISKIILLDAQEELLQTLSRRINLTLKQLR